MQRTAFVLVIPLLMAACQLGPPLSPAEQFAERACTELGEAPPDEAVAVGYRISEEAWRIGVAGEDFGEALQARCPETLERLHAEAMRQQAEEQQRMDEMRAWIDVAMDGCDAATAHGRLTNQGPETVDGYILVEFWSGQTQLSSGAVEFHGLEPGEGRDWTAEPDSSVHPSGPDEEYEVTRCAILDRYVWPAGGEIGVPVPEAPSLATPAP
jgi:hypothetical protein